MTLLEEIVSLHHLGLTRSQMADRLSQPIARVDRTLSEARKRGLIARATRATAININFPREHLERYQQEAAVRGTSVYALARSILSAVAEDNLFSAVLED